jgi:hypothetical protein
MMPTAWDFQNQLMAILNAGRQIGKSYVDVESGSLHRQVGGYPDSNHRMPVCCEVMRRMMRRGDSVLKEPSSEQDTALLIRYMV